MVNHEHNRTDAVDALQVFGDLLRQDRRLLGGHLARVFGEHDAKLEENMHAVALIMPHLETQPRPDRQGHEDDARAFRGWSGETVLNHLNVLSEYMDIDRRNVASELAMFGDDVTAHAWLSDQISADGDRSDKTKPVVYAVRYFDLDNGPPVAGSDWRLDPKDSLRYIKYLGAADDWRRAHSLAVAEKADLISFQGHVCRAEEGKREPGALVSTHHQTGHNPYQQPFFLMTRPRRTTSGADGRAPRPCRGMHGTPPTGRATKTIRSLRSTPARPRCATSCRGCIQASQARHAGSAGRQRAQTQGGSLAVARQPCHAGRQRRLAGGRLRRSGRADSRLQGTSAGTATASDERALTQSLRLAAMT